MLAPWPALAATIARDSNDLQQNSLRSGTGNFSEQNRELELPNRELFAPISELKPRGLIEEFLACDRQKAASNAALQVAWQKTLSRRRRAILVPDGISPQQARPIRSENRATLVASIAGGRRWLDELIAEQTATTVSIAKRDRCSVRKVTMTISLAFLAPDLVKAAIDGRLPHGMGVPRLADLPAEWSRQHQMLGLAAQ